MNRPESNSDRPEDEALEVRLARQPLRPTPTEWKSEILAAARASTEKSPERNGEPRGFSPRPSPVREPSGWELFWARFPVAPIGLATVWGFVWLAGATDRSLNESVAFTAPPVSVEQVAEARAQRAALWQLAGADDRGVRQTAPAKTTEPTPSPALRPRSDRRSRNPDFFGFSLDVEEIPVT